MKLLKSPEFDEESDHFEADCLWYMENMASANLLAWPAFPNNVKDSIIFSLLHLMHA